MRATEDEARPNPEKIREKNMKQLKEAQKIIIEHYDEILKVTRKSMDRNSDGEVIQVTETEYKKPEDIDPRHYHTMVEQADEAEWVSTEEVTAE